MIELRAALRAASTTAIQRLNVYSQDQGNQIRQDQLLVPNNTLGHRNMFWHIFSPDASRCLQMPLDGSRCLQIPDDSRCLQMPPRCLGASRRLQMPPDATRCLQMPPDDSRCLQMPPRCLQMPPDASRCSQMPPDAFR